MQESCCVTRDSVGRKFNQGFNYGIYVVNQVTVKPLVKEKLNMHYVKSIQIQSYFWFVFPVFSPNTGKYGPEIAPYLDTFHTVML